MKFRKRHREETAEVFTDSLNDILFILLMFFLIVATLANPNVVKVGLPRGTLMLIRQLIMAKYSELCGLLKKIQQRLLQG